MKVVINTCYGGFGLSDAAYEKLIEWGVPVGARAGQERDPETGLYLPQPANEGEVIFDRSLGYCPARATRPAQAPARLGVREISAFRPVDSRKMGQNLAAQQPGRLCCER